MNIDQKVAGTDLLETVQQLFPEKKVRVNRAEAPDKAGEWTRITTAQIIDATRMLVLEDVILSSKGRWKKGHVRVFEGRDLADKLMSRKLNTIQANTSFLSLGMNFYQTPTIELEVAHPDDAGDIKHYARFEPRNYPDANGHADNYLTSIALMMKQNARGKAADSAPQVEPISLEDLFLKMNAGSLGLPPLTGRRTVWDAHGTDHDE